MLQDATPPDIIYTDAELAPRLGVERSTLQQWRARKRGPPFYRIGRAVRYRWSEVQAWLDRRRGGELPAADGDRIASP